VREVHRVNIAGSEWTEWGVRWTSPYGSHITPTKDRAAAVALQRVKRLQADCTSEVVRRDVTATEWGRRGKVTTVDVSDDVEG
jgi:hypothetical protein